jgi:hypothetical protein
LSTSPGRTALAASDPGVDHPQIPVFLDRNRQDDAVRPENRVDHRRAALHGTRSCRDEQVITPLGRGESDKPERGYNYHTLAKDLDGFLRAHDHGDREQSPGTRR